MQPRIGRETRRQFEQQNDEKRRALTRACEKAQYEADRVRRQYDAVDPQNRLVAGELEARWNEALLRQRTTGSAIQTNLGR